MPPRNMKPHPSRTHVGQRISASDIAVSLSLGDAGSPPGRPGSVGPAKAKYWSVARSLGPDGTPCEVPCPRGLNHATYQRLVNEYNRVLAELTALPNRKLWPHLRTAYEHQFLNRIVRIRCRPRVADAGTAGQALVPGERCPALPGRLHKIRPALDSDRLRALRARWPSGSPILCPRGKLLGVRHRLKT